MTYLAGFNSKKFARNTIDDIIQQAIGQQEVDMPLSLLKNQVPADVKFKLVPTAERFVPDIDVSVALPYSLGGVEAAIFCENAFTHEDRDIGFDIDKMNGKYPMSSRCQGDKVEVSVFTPLGINFTLSKSFTRKEWNGTDGMEEVYLD